MKAFSWADYRSDYCRFRHHIVRSTAFLHKLVSKANPPGQKKGDP